MQNTTVDQAKSSFKIGLSSGVTIAIGYMPVAFTYGFIAKTTGLTFWETVLMSMIVYAGAAQYMALDMIAKGIGAVELILTTFIVNIRHLLMSASLNEKVEKDARWKKAIYAYGITDETFSVASVQDGKLSSGFMFGLNVIAYTSWFFFSGVGYLAGSSLPDLFQAGMSIALYALFIGLLVPSMKKSGKVVFLAGLAGVLNSLFIGFGLFSTGWSIVVATIISAVFTETIIWLRRERGRDHE